jgi:AhpD family alkylhydroperoxidase
MSSKLVRRGLRPLSLLQVNHVKPVSYRSADPLVTRVYREVEVEFGVLAPPVILHASSPDLLAATWIILRETLIVPGKADRAAKEAVAVAISKSNECPFCFTVHTARLNGLVPTAPAVGPAADWAEANLIRPSGPGPVPFPPDQAAEFVGVAVMMEYLNRMVNVFLPENPMPPGAPSQAMGVVGPVLNWLQRTAQARPFEPGTSVDLLPSAGSAPAPGWAAGHPAIEEGYRRAVIAFEEAGERSVPSAVRDLITSRLRSWDGSPPGISRSWVEDALEPLALEDRAAGKLALLAAFASYQIDAAVIADYRAGGAGDGALVDVVGWASMAAALEIGGWMRIADESRQDAAT